MSSISYTALPEEDRKSTAKTFELVFKKGKCYQQINGRLVKRVEIGPAAPEELVTKISLLYFRKKEILAEARKLQPTLPTKQQLEQYLKDPITHEIALKNFAEAKKKIDEWKEEVERIKKKLQEADKEVKALSDAVLEVLMFHNDGDESVYITERNVLLMPTQDYQKFSRLPTEFSYSDEDEIIGKQTITVRNFSVIGITSEKYATLKSKIQFGRYIQKTDMPSYPISGYESEGCWEDNCTIL